MKFFAFILLFSLVFCSEIESEFSKWAQTNNKVYATDEEYQYRMAVFASNIEIIDQLNAESNGGATFGINEFSDLSSDEFRAMYNGFVPGPEDAERPLLDLPNVAAPDTFSWISSSKVTAVKN
jgi:hypothetical protein